MKPTLITEPSLLVPARVAAWLGPLVDCVQNEAQRDRLTVPPDVVEALDKLRLLGDAHRQGKANVPQGVPMGDKPRALVRLSTKEVAAILGTKRRNVTALLERGLLSGEKNDSNKWRVDSESVAARLKKMTQEKT